jgi:3-hydroxyacyl-CoA dehydrogenase/enoyl-CoA hydratase/3-hydroxybutyryl-CoA epimerase
MGAAIAQAIAISGCRVILKDIEQRFVDAGLEKIDKLFRDAVKAGAIHANEAPARRQAITATTEWGPVAQADLAIEAVVERLPVKQDVFRELDRVLNPGALIASNTSALPISELAAVTQRPGQVAGLHFFNPVHKMPLVEVVRCPKSNEQTLAALVLLVRQLGKVPIVVAESPGFLVNRVLFPYLDEAVRLVCEGARVEEVDRVATRFGMPMGPLELLDQVGIDIAADVAKTLAPFAAEPSPTPARLTEMVQAGRLGKKSGTGFYRFRNGHKTKAVSNQQSTSGSAVRIEPLRVGDGEELNGMQQRLMFTLLNEAAKCFGERVVTEPWMVDLGLVMGTGYAPFRGGPMQTIDDWGVRTCVAGLMRLTKECGPRFAPCHLLLDLSARGGTVFGATHEMASKNACA